MTDRQEQTSVMAGVAAFFDDLQRLLTITGKPKWATPVLISLGFLSSLAETLGLTLIVLFIYSALGEGADTANAGAMGGVLSLLGGYLGDTTRLAGLIFLAIVARAALAFIYQLISSYLSEGINERARNRIHDQYLTVAYEQMRQRPQSDLMEILGTESWLVASAYQSLTRFIINGCSILVFLAFLFLLSPRIALIAIVGSLMVAGVMRMFSGKAKALGERVKAIHRELGLHMLLTLQAMRTIRAYGLEAPHQRRFTAASRLAHDASRSQAMETAWISPLTEVGYLGILCVIIAASSWWHIGFPVTLGSVALLYRMQPHVREIEGNLLYLTQNLSQLHAVRQMLETDDKQYLPEGTLPVTGIQSGIAFRDVVFAYASGGNSAPVLDHVSFDIPAGRTTALIGASGAGKTTIVNLLLRLYQPTSGRILIDGVPLSDLQRTEWLNLVGVSGQDVDLIEGTVIDNIRMARDNATDEEIIAICHEVGVADFVEHLEYGFRTWVGYEGLRFSGGQRQRIALARALLRDPSLLILDEATSAMDHSIEDRVRRAVDHRTAGRTKVVITHQLENLTQVDHAIWIRDGQVAAAGHPDEVLPIVRAAMQ